jgi:hypothetical protein
VDRLDALAEENLTNRARSLGEGCTKGLREHFMLKLKWRGQLQATRKEAAELVQEIMESPAMDEELAKTLYSRGVNPAVLLDNAKESLQPERLLEVLFQ